VKTHGDHGADYEEEPDRAPEERDLLEYRETRDPLALIRVFDALALPLLVVAAHAEGDAERAVGTVESTFLALCDDVEAWTPDIPLFGWLTACVVRRAASDGAIDVHAPRAIAPRDAELAVARAVSSAFETLPPILRQTLVRTSLRGLSPAEIGRSLHVDEATVRARRDSAFEHLRQELPPDVHRATDLTASGHGLGRVRLAVLERIQAVSEPADPESPPAPRTDSRWRWIWVGVVVALAAATAVWALLGT